MSNFESHLRKKKTYKFAFEFAHEAPPQILLRLSSKVPCPFLVLHVVIFR